MLSRYERDCYSGTMFQNIDAISEQQISQVLVGTLALQVFITSAGTYTLRTRNYFSNLIPIATAVWKS